MHYCGVTPSSCNPVLCPKFHSLTAQDVVLAVDLGIPVIIRSFSFSLLTGLAKLSVQTVGERPILASSMSEWRQVMDYV